MKSELCGLIKRQYKNFRIFKAYSASTLLKEAFLFPKDLLSDSGYSSNVLNIALFVTLRCNAKCAMCNISGILNDGNMKDIPLDKIERLLDEVTPYHPSIILFGGEPFIRKDIVDIVRAVKKRGLSTGMFTNGLLIDDATIKALVAERLDYIAFSLQGVKEVHDKIIGVPGAYEKMVKSIRSFTAFKPRTTKVVIHATVCEHNAANLNDLAGLGQELGVDLIRFGHPSFYSSVEASGCTAQLKKVFRDDLAIKAMSYVYDIRGHEELYVKNVKDVKARFGDKVSFSPELGDEELKSWYSRDFKSKRNCLFVWRGLFIYPNGDVYPCESINYKMGNVFEEGFLKVWNGPKYKEFRRVLRKGLLPACARCCKL